MRVLHDPSLATVALRGAAGAVIAASIAILAYRWNALTASGAAAAAILGALAFAFGGWLVAAAIVIFFASGSILGRVGNRAAEVARSRAAKGAQRDALQVLANGGVATACAIAGTVAAFNAWPSASRWMVAAVCAIAAASGDTWSTEIGAFSRGAVRLVTNLQPVSAGTSGGITPLGTIAAPIGGAVVALAGVARFDLLSLPVWLGVGALAGLAGSSLDSVLGATLQGTWRCSRCGGMFETAVHKACGVQGVLARGLPWLDNDAVNAAATLGGGVLGYLLVGVLP